MVSVETVSRKALDSGLGWKRLRTEDSPVSDGGGEEDEPRAGNPDLPLPRPLPLIVSYVPLWLPAGPFPFWILGKNSSLDLNPPGCSHRSWFCELFPKAHNLGTALSGWCRLPAQGLPQ